MAAPPPTRSPLTCAARSSPGTGIAPSPAVISHPPPATSTTCGPGPPGGPTTLANCLLLCSFHHLIAVHRWGWSLALGADGTVAATSPDGTRTLHSHSPPSAAA